MNSFSKRRLNIRSGQVGPTFANALMIRGVQLTIIARR